MQPVPGPEVGVGVGVVGVGFGVVGSGRVRRRRVRRRRVLGRRRRVQRVERRGVGGLLVAAAVEEQRGARGAPRVGVAHAPHGDAGAARDGQAGLDDAAVVVRLRGARALDVELGDLHVHAERGEARDRRLVVARHRALRVEVRLEADAVDRDAAGLEVPDHVVDGLGLGVGPVVGVVVVVAELGAGVGGAGGRGTPPRSSRCRCAAGWSRDARPSSRRRTPRSPRPRRRSCPCSGWRPG